MSDLEDYELGEAGGETERGTPLRPRRSGPPLGALAGVIAVLAVGAAAFFWLRPKAKVEAPLPTPTVATPAPSPAEATPTEPPVKLPPLEESDAFVRDLAKAIASHPQLGVWLGQPGLIRTVAVVVQNIGEGRSPAPFLRFLTPSVKFKTVRKGGKMYADPKSHAAYDTFADGVSAVDAAECARVYRILQPLLRAAYKELGYRGQDFDATLGRALGLIAATPVPKGDVELRQGRAFIEYVDPRLESLSFAQKQVIRMGPRNARIIQAKAADLATALAPETPATP